ncbi:MAG: zinc ribbon domain-containing protein [Oscillospiraceae bacterium]|nr:zinc ribbon domain-containing protein [Oscillospiraceae bacterium]
MYCRNCNLSYPDGNSFCAKCGAALEPEGASYAPEQTVAEAPTVLGDFLEEPAYAEASESSHAIPTPPMEPWTEQAPKKKKGWKVFGIVCASLAGLLLIGGIIAAVMIFRSPYYRLYAAGRNSVEELDQLTHGNAQLAEIMEPLGSSDMGSSVDMDLDLAMELLGQKVDVGTVGFDYAIDYERRQAWFDFGIESDLSLTGSKMGFSMSVDEEELRMRIGSEKAPVLSAPTLDFGQSFAGSKLEQDLDSREVRTFLSKLSLNVFDNYTLEDFMEEQGGWKTLLQYGETEEGEMYLSFAPELDVYGLCLDCQKINDLYRGYLRSKWERVLGKEAFMTLPDELQESFDQGILPEDADRYVVRLGIDKKDRLAAVELFPQGKQEEATYIYLYGEQNLWSEILLHYDGEDYRLTLERKPEGLRLSTDKGSFVEWSETKKQFTCLIDGTEWLISCSEDGEKLYYEIDGMISIESENALFGAETELILDGVLVVAPVETVELLTGETVPLFDYSSEELADLLEDALEEAVGLG